MRVGDVILHRRSGPFHLADRNGHEWHSDPGFFRYRNNFELGFRPRPDCPDLWLADEVRYDFDQSRWNQNDFKAGLDIPAGRQLRFRLWYDLEAKRRSRPGWVRTGVVQLMLIVRLPGTTGERPLPGGRSPGLH